MPLYLMFITILWKVLTRVASWRVASPSTGDSLLTRFLMGWISQLYINSVLGICSINSLSAYFFPPRALQHLVLFICYTGDRLYFVVLTSEVLPPLLANLFSSGVIMCWVSFQPGDEKQTFHLCQFLVHCLLAPNPPSLSCFVILELDAIRHISSFAEVTS